MERVILEVLDDLDIGATLYDPETSDILGINKQLEDIYGYTEAQLREMEVSEYTVREGISQSELDRCIQTVSEDDSQTFECQIERATGEQIWVTVKLVRTTFDGTPYVLAEIQEITDQKETERKRREVLNRMSDGFFVVDTDWEITHANEKAARVLADAMGPDRTAGDVEGLHLWEEIPEAVDTLFYDKYHEARRTQEPVTFEEYYEPLDIWFDYRIYPSESGLSIYFYDATERHQQTDLIEHRQHVLKEMHDIIVDQTRDFDDQVEALLALGRSELGTTFGSLSKIHGDDYVFEVVDTDSDTIQAGDIVPVSATNCEVTASNEQTLVLGDIERDAPEQTSRAGYAEWGISCYIGAPVYVEDDVYGTFCFYDEEPREEQFSEWGVTLVDLMSQWVSYELTQAEREREYRQLTEQISDAYYAVDTDFTITYWNDVAADRMATPSENILGENLWEQFPELQGTVVEERFREALETQDLVSCEYYYEPLDYWMALQIHPDEDGLAVIGTNITDRKEYEAQLERSNERLQEFAYILSHDLQEPLRMVESYVDLLEIELEGDLDEETREYMEFAADGAERMRSMIDGLLQYSRVESSGSDFEETDVTEILEGVSRDLQLKLDSTNSDLNVEDLPTIKADSDQVSQLFQNLIKNAIEHGGEDTTIDVMGEETAEGYEFVVSDDGPGIPPEQQDRIFRLFDKGQSSDGTGIGLAICERIVNRHGGTIDVESTLGSGTTVHIAFEK
jgi:PAS domain S-box-containing protein